MTEDKGIQARVGVRRRDGTLAIEREDVLHCCCAGRNMLGNCLQTETEMQQNQTIKI